MEARRRAAERARAEAQRGLANILRAVEQGILVPGTKERISELEEQQGRAEHDLATILDSKIDPEDFSDFLQWGATQDDSTLLDAFVYQAVVSNEEVVVTLNYDIRKGEPRTLS